MVDWLLIWGATQAVGILVYPILQDLAKEGAKDFTKDFFKDSLKHVLLREKDPRQIAAGKAIKEFLQLMQQQLKFRCKLPDAEIKQYIQEVKKFIRNSSVKEILGKAFEVDCESLDARVLEDTWKSLQLKPMPPTFNWGSITDQYLMKAQELLWESEDLRSILDSQNLETIQRNTTELAGIAPEFDLRRYQEGLQERYSNLNLDSLDTSVYDYREKLKVWQVFIAQNVRECQEYLPQVYEIPKEHQKRLRASNQLEAEIDPQEWERYKQIYYQQPVRSVLDIVNDPQTNPYVVILGDPGSGKSMLLQYIALNWANSPLNNVISQPIPLLIELRSYMRDRNSGQCKDFLEFFHKGSVICRLNQHQLHEQLKAGRVLVMFDGLDEVFDPAQREDAITDIHRFTNDYPNVRVIVTSRIIGYKPQRLRDTQFRHFMLQDLESEQIQDFIYRWHELTFTDEADKVRKRERLQQAIKTSSAIGELAENPLLLTMMAILNRKQELPRDRPELYNEASRVLLHHWDVEQKLLENPKVDSVAIDYKDKQVMLRQVAYHMQAADKGLAGNLIRGEDLERILTGYLRSIEVSQARTVARLLIEQLRSRNFILCFVGADSYAFVHRTFLEYFCACEFVERFGKRGLEGGLTLEELKTEVFGKHWQDESWHEVLRLIAGMIDTKFAGEIIDDLIDKRSMIEIATYLNKGDNQDDEEQSINLFLAAECLSEVRNRSAITATANRLLARLKDLAGYRYIEWTPRNSVPSKIYESCTRAVSTISTIWKDESGTVSWLKSLAHSDNWATRQAVVQELAKGWKDNPETLLILKTLARLDKVPVVLHRVMEQLTEGWKDDPDTLPILKTCAQSGEHWSTRWGAIQQLVWGWKDEPWIFEFLFERAINDPFEHEEDYHINPRQTALESIIKQYPDHPQTLPLCKDRAENDPDEKVRVFLIQELAEGWKDEPGMFEFLCNCALNDPFEREQNWQINPRQTALEIIIKQYPDHSQTLPLLQDRSENDPDEKVRELAKKKLEQLERQN